MNRKYNILYVDDELSNLNIFKNTFRREYTVFTALNAKEGLDILQSEKIDLVLTDQRMPEMNGVDFLKHVLSQYPDLNRILITAYTDFDAIKNAINDAQIFQYIQKPWSEEKLRSTIEKALEVSILKKENEALTNQLKDKNAALEEMNEQLLKSDALKTEFLSIISHEIRTPLNGMIGAINLLECKINDQRSKELVELHDILKKSVKRFERFALLAEKITFFKADYYKINKVAVNAKNLIYDSVEMLQQDYKAKNIQLVYSLKEMVDLKIDNDLIKICIKELLENAIKYSEPNNSIYINTYKIGQKFYIEVQDEGEGFEQKILDNLFQPFITGDKFRRHNIGLDLFLVNRIMTAHEGELKLKNNEDKGACVKLVFNLK